MDPNTIRVKQLPGYKTWRMKRVRKGFGGERAVDVDLVVLSKVITFGVTSGLVEFNYIRSGRPQFRRSSDVRRSREVAPPDAATIHQLAEQLFLSPRSAVLGWQLLFAMFTGCRTSELLRLRTDAKTGEPGHVDQGHLHLGRRSKHGTNPFAIIGPEFKAMIQAFRRWHRGTGSDWYFPSPNNPAETVQPEALNRALARMCKLMELPHITPHGLRSFYVTKRRSDGVSDIQIAAEIGDKTVALMQTTYGARPANWTGGKALKWVPTKGRRAWASGTSGGLRTKNLKIKNQRKSLIMNGGR